MKKVTYLGGQVGDQAWKFGRHWVKAGHIGDPTGHKVEPWDECDKCMWNKSYMRTAEMKSNEESKKASPKVMHISMNLSCHQ